MELKKHCERCCVDSEKLWWCSLIAILLRNRNFPMERPHPLYLMTFLKSKKNLCGFMNELPVSAVSAYS